MACYLEKHSPRARLLEDIQETGPTYWIIAERHFEL